MVVGNPFVLSKDKNWNELLTYCIKNNAYTGCPFEPTHLAKEEDELLQLSQLSLESKEEDEDEDETTARDDEWVFVDKL